MLCARPLKKKFVSLQSEVVPERLDHVICWIFRSAQCIWDWNARLIEPNFGWIGPKGCKLKSCVSRNFLFSSMMGNNLPTNGRFPTVRIVCSVHKRPYKRPYLYGTGLERRSSWTRADVLRIPCCHNRAGDLIKSSKLGSRS